MWLVLLALEHLRKKIELSTEKIRLAKQKEDQAKKVSLVRAGFSNILDVFGPD